MAQIQVTDLTFSYDGSADDVFKDVTFNIDTDWKLGLIGRNGKGKTTLLNLLMGRYEYRGSIKSSYCFAINCLFLFFSGSQCVVPRPEATPGTFRNANSWIHPRLTESGTC